MLLHLVAGIDPAAPVVFLDTGKLFPETLAYRDTLVRRLGLRDVRSVGPSAATLAASDPAGKLWETDPDVCCWHRKVEPLDEALAGFPAWITGRKRFQGGQRQGGCARRRSPITATRLRIPPSGWKWPSRISQAYRARS